MYVSNNNMQKEKDAKIERLQSSISTLKDSVQESQLKVMDMQYFSLENNDDALAYYDHLQLLETNEKKGDNPLIPYEGMEGDFKLNKIKILNHKWIVADFSDGKFWGEVLIKYELKDDFGIDFTLLDHLLYTHSN